MTRAFETAVGTVRPTQPGAGVRPLEPDSPGDTKGRWRKRGPRGRRPRGGPRGRRGRPRVARRLDTATGRRGLRPGAGRGVGGRVCVGRLRRVDPGRRRRVRRRDPRRRGGGVRLAVRRGVWGYETAVDGEVTGVYVRPDVAGGRRGPPSTPTWSVALGRRGCRRSAGGVAERGPLLRGPRLPAGRRADPPVLRPRVDRR